jgi:hypothetical protein
MNTHRHRSLVELLLLPCCGPNRGREINGARADGMACFALCMAQLDAFIVTQLDVFIVTQLDVFIVN